MSKFFLYVFFNIMRISETKHYNQNFTAYHIANSKNILNNIETNLKIYDLTPNDSKFLKDMKASVNLEKLMPELDKNKLNVWQQIFNIAVQQISNSSHKKGLLAVFNNKPCGILTYTPNNTKYKIETICTWPAEPSQKIPLAGKTLFDILFLDFLKSKANFIDMDAVTNGPFNAVSKYMSMGFKQRGGENNIIAMRINRENVLTSVEKLSNFIKIKFQKTQNEIDLSKTLTL